MKQISELVCELQKESSTTSMFLLAYMHEMGQLVSKDLIKSYKLYKQAIELSTDSSPDRFLKILAIYNTWVLEVSGAVQVEQTSGLPEWVALARENDNGYFLYIAGVMFEFGIHFKQDYDIARKYYELAKDDYPYAALRLGLLHEHGSGCKQDLQKANEYYKQAESSGDENASMYLRQDLLSIWPNEEWMAKDDMPSMGAAYKTSCGFKMLTDLVVSYESDLSSHPGLNSDIERWFKTLVHTGIANNTYSIAKKSLDVLNDFFNNSGNYLSNGMLMMPLYARSSNTVESYVKLYLRAKTWLTRAKLSGSKQAVKDLQSLLELHKDRVEVTCKNIYDKFVANVDADEAIWHRALKLVSRKQREFHSELTLVSTMPSDNVHELIDHSIESVDIDNYEMWSTLVIDPNELTKLHKKFFDTAVNSGQEYEASEFLTKFEFDINYLIHGKSISPLEFLISQGFVDLLSKVMSRGDVDVNFNCPVFCAIAHADVRCIQLFLDHPLIDLDIKKNVNGSLLSIEEFVNKGSKAEIRLLIKNHMLRMRQSSDPNLVGNLYFQYKKQYKEADVKEKPSQTSVVDKKHTQYKPV